MKQQNRKGRVMTDYNSERKQLTPSVCPPDTLLFCHKKEISYRYLIKYWIQGGRVNAGNQQSN